MFECYECGTVVESDEKPVDWVAVYRGPDDTVYFCSECNIKKFHPVSSDLHEMTVDHILGMEPADMVDKPSHYANVNNIECIYWIREMLGMDEFRGYLKGNILKYIWRYDFKGKPVQDLEKAKKYIDFLIEDLEYRAEQERSS